MPKQEKPSHSEQEHQVLNVLTLVVVVLGVIGSVYAYFGYQDADLIAVDRLVRYNLGFTGEFVLTIRKCCLLFCISAAVIAVGALAGLYGVKQNSKPITCVYNVSLILVGLFMFFIGVHAHGRQATVEPIISRQIADFCRAPVFIRLTQNLQCPDSAGMAALAAGQVVLCSDTCQERAELLNKQGEGCLLLMGLCNDWEYTSSPSGDATGFVPPIFMRGGVQESVCARACDHDLNCYGYAFNTVDSACYIKSNNMTRYTSPTWTNGGVVNAMTEVQIKGDNGVKVAFQTYGSSVARFMISLGVALVIVAALTWCILYNQNVNKPGKPSALQVFRSLCCCGAGENEFREKLPFNDPDTDGSISG